MITDPKYYTLNPRTKLEAVAEHEIAVVKRIKSRIIRQDALKIVAQVEQIKAVDPTLEVSLICTHNICSKSLQLLDEKGITVHYSEML